MLHRVEKRIPMRKSFEQIKSQRFSFQCDIEEKTNLSYSVGRIDIKATANCCRIRVVGLKLGRECLNCVRLAISG